MKTAILASLLATSSAKVRCQSTGSTIKTDKALMYVETSPRKADAFIKDFAAPNDPREYENGLQLQNRFNWEEILLNQPIQAGFLLFWTRYRLIALGDGAPGEAITHCFRLVLAGCTTHLEITEPLNPEANLKEGVLYFLPDAQQQSYDYIINGIKTAQHRARLLWARINHSPLFVITKAHIKRLNNDTKKDRAKREYDKFEIQCFLITNLAGLFAASWNRDGKSWEECRDWSIRKHPRLCKGDLPP